MSKIGRIGYRPTWAEINLNNLSHNYQQLKKKLSSGIKVMVTVKADAYGHGLIPVAKRLVSLGIDFFGVASIDEGIQLRGSGIRTPILILGMVLKTDIEPLFKHNLATTVCDIDFARALDREGRSLKKVLNVHIKVDTGMGRIGVLHQDAGTLVREIIKLKFINVEGIFTHFAFADMNEEFTRYQIKLFKQLIDKLNKEGIIIPLVHAANSMGVISYSESHYNMVRPGLVIYGLYPRDNIGINLRPVLSLKTRVVYIKKVPKGSGISYGHSYVTKKNTLIATLPIGYGDGYPRNLSNKAPVLIRGKRFTINGRICMDQVMVDVGDESIKTGDEVVLIGSQGKSKVTTEELANLSGTIPYEIVCGLGGRIPRVYI